MLNIKVYYISTIIFSINMTKSIQLKSIKKMNQFSII
jgi:hypothetical protein